MAAQRRECFLSITRIVIQHKNVWKSWESESRHKLCTQCNCSFGNSLSPGTLNSDDRNARLPPSGCCEQSPDESRRNFLSHIGTSGFIKSHSALRTSGGNWSSFSNKPPKPLWVRSKTRRRLVELQLSFSGIWIGRWRGVGWCFACKSFFRLPPLALPPQPRDEYRKKNHYGRGEGEGKKYLCSGRCIKLQISIVAHCGGGSSSNPVSAS